MASIEIRTTQNVTIEYELASLRDRFFAFFVDLVIYYLAYYLLWMILVGLFSGAMTSWGFNFIAMLNVVGLIFYHLLSEVFANGQSIGKKVLGLKVVRLDGLEPGLGDYLLRAIFLLVDFFLSIGVLGALFIGSTFKNQRLGDLAANTAVIRRKNHQHFRLSDILNIQTLEHYVPRYPAVKHLKESDVLLIKNLLSRHKAWRNAAHTEAVQLAVKTICKELDMAPPQGNKIEFLKTLVRDYIVLTR
jgi:uncharacterized RDD family membrane protein YckC